MIFPDRRTILVHVPKTAGNTLTSVLLPYSNDSLALVDHHDGIDRFGLVGPLTAHKHAGIADYSARLGTVLGEYTVWAVYRDPVDRLLSLYYSPHRWLRPDGKGGFALPPASEMAFCATDFATLVAGAPTCGDMLDRANLATLPRRGHAGRHATGARVELIAFDDLDAGLARMCDAMGIDRPPAPPPRRNASARPASVTLTPDDLVRVTAIVRDSPHWADRDFASP